MELITQKSEKTGLKKTILKIKYPLIAFAVTELVLIIYMVGQKIMPFGDESLLSIDLFHQYYPMILEKLRNYFSSGWSWDGALGFPRMAQSAYYSNSLFYLPLLLFSGTARIAAFDIIATLRMSLCAFTFALFCEYKFKKHSLLSSAVGIAYALCTYAVSFMAQVMWTDVMLLAPVVLIGIEELVSRRRTGIYIISLAAAIYLNFYASFALCIFCVLYFTVALISCGKRGIKRTLCDAGAFAGSSLLSGALCAPTLISVYMAIKNTAAAEISFDWTAKFYHGIDKISDALTPASGLSLEYGVANIYCISALVFFCFLFLLNKNIPRARRASVFLLCGFMLLSFELNILDYIWHGFHFPNQLPGRQSYLFVLIALIAAYEAITCFKGITFPRLTVSVLGASLILAVGIYGEKGKGHLIALAIVAVCFLIFAAAMFLEKIKNKARFASIALALVIICEAVTVSLFNLFRFGYISNGKRYCEYEQDMSAVTEKYISDDDDFFRSELYPKRLYNDGMLYGYRTVSYYSSTMNKNAYRLLDSLGNHVYAKNVSVSFTCTPVLDMMFAVKYRYSASEKQCFPYYERLGNSGNINVYKNSYYLPLAYVVSDDIKDFDINGGRGIERQDEFIYLATGKSRRLFKRVASAGEEMKNCFISGDYLVPDDINIPMEYSQIFISGGDESYYVQLGFNVGAVTVSVGDEIICEGNAQAYELFPISALPYGTEFKITVKVKGYNCSTLGMELYSVSPEDISEAYAILSENTMSVSHASDEEISGTVKTSRGGVLYSSVPFGEGWALYIDGKEAETYPLLGGALLGADISEGTHEILYKYHRQGRVLGLIISISAVAATVIIIKKKKTSD